MTKAKVTEAQLRALLTIANHEDYRQQYPEYLGFPTSTYDRRSFRALRRKGLVITVRDSSGGPDFDGLALSPEGVDALWEHVG